jgi:hypothetical protein
MDRESERKNTLHPDVFNRLAIELWEKKTRSDIFLQPVVCLTVPLESLFLLLELGRM